MATRRIFQLLGEILHYPQGDLVAKAVEAKELASQVDAEAGVELGRFVSYAQATPLTSMEDLYTTTFDLSPVCPPYVGYHLFGESFKRGAFMVNLQADQRRWGIEAGGELPDHLALVLSLYAVAEDADLARDLREECLIPAMEKMDQSFGESENVYRKVLTAARLILEREKESVLEGGPVDA